MSPTSLVSCVKEVPSGTFISDGARRMPSNFPESDHGAEIIPKELVASINNTIFGRIELH